MCDRYGVSVRVLNPAVGGVVYQIRVFVRIFTTFRASYLLDKSFSKPHAESGALIVPILYPNRTQVLCSFHCILSAHCSPQLFRT